MEPLMISATMLNVLDDMEIKDLPRRKGNPGRKRRPQYKDCVCAFDIETTTDGDLNWMYVWQFQFDDLVTVVGRTWDEFRDLLQWLQDHSNGSRWMVFVHNLSYEFQYLQGIYPFTNEEVFATDTRKVAKCEMFDCIEFRCSLFLSNMSLDNFTRTMRVDHRKQSGDDFNYSKIRYPWTRLTRNEIKYATYDVIGLVEAVKALMRANNDDLNTIPLTNTGYPRRDIKDLMRMFSRYKLQQMQPDYPLFCLLRETYRGGNTHASRFWAGTIVDSAKVGRILSYDRSSSYPDVLVNRPYPMGAWTMEEAPDPERLYHLLKKNKAVIFRVGFTNVRLHDQRWPVPYLSKDKCRRIQDGYFDNGRILSAEYLETSLTDIDFRILLNEYDYDDMAIDVLYWTEYQELPMQFKAMVNRYYHTKTRLKGVEGQEVLYNVSKAKLNALYGMTAQVPVKQNVIYNGGEWSLGEEAEEDLLKKHNKNAWSSYAWGCWCTAWARYELELGILKAEEFSGSFIYADTDSIKYIDKGQDWSEMNAEYRTRSEKRDASAVDPQGIRHWMGVFEEDAEYRRFITLGSKRYAYEDMKGKLHITVSGVSKKKGAEELQKLENFRDGFVWYHGGKTESKYVDHPDQRYITRCGKKIEITPYVIINDTTYTLSLSDEYRSLINVYLK